jgi:5-methyltetrahydropteroyltriglutamate--homocysteine methyltransferase
MARPAPITIPTEPIGSIPRPVDRIERIAKGDSEDSSLDPLSEDAIRDTIERFEAAGSPVVTDGEQSKYHNFCTYSVYGLPNTAPDGFYNSVLGRSYAPPVAAHTRPFPL